MSNHNRGGEAKEDKRLIREAKEEAFHARRQLRRERPNPSLAAKRDLAAAADDYRDQLLDYKDERALETPWNERDYDIDILPRLLKETTTVTQSLNRRGSPSTTREVPKVAKIDGQRLISISKELDKIAAELGFAPDAKRSREQFHIASPDQEHPEPVNDNVTKPGQSR